MDADEKRGGVRNMKAAQINKYGSIEVVEINKNTPKPAASRGKILVEVYAAGVNPIDWKIREGYIPLKFPATLGGDFSGDVADVGEGVSGFKKGLEVYGYASVLGGGSGSFAEFVSADVGAQERRHNSFYVRAASSRTNGTI
ncbi:MAG: alcohol dehydrogenase catalytic domain-containing protein [Candidatus Methanoperedens sp.]|nr:alcohol dehydrogenase catalytic domain-containing protein [Candidatus Methanoperedens sp.]